MFQNDYRREMDGLRPSPAAVERLNRLLEEGVPARRPRRLGRRAAAALALCAALCVTAVAAGPSLPCRGGGVIVPGFCGTGNVSKGDSVPLRKRQRFILPTYTRIRAR